MLALRLQALATEVLDEVIGRPESVVLLDFPNHSNVGDSAIWLGEAAYLAHRGLHPRYVCEATTYSAATLKARTGKGTVLLLHGGGNFGDLWPTYQRFRETVLADFPGQHVVQLPQTIWFDDAEGALRSARQIRRHSSFTVLVRDMQSLDRATKLGIDARICPDSAFLLGPLEHSTETETDVLWLLRSDHERREWTGIPAGSRATDPVVDWLTEPTSRRASPRHLSDRVWHHFQSLRDALPESLQFMTGVNARRSNATALRRLTRGVNLLSSGETVVTDRLHGHILSLLLDIPHVALDTRGAKVSNFMDTWGTSMVPTVCQAASLDEAASLATALLGEARSERTSPPAGTAA